MDTRTYRCPRCDRELDRDYVAQAPCARCGACPECAPHPDGLGSSDRCGACAQPERAAVHRTMPTVRATQCGSTEDGAIATTSELRWPPRKWPTAVRYLDHTGEARELTMLPPLMGPNGEIALVRYADASGWVLDVWAK